MNVGVNRRECTGHAQCNAQAQDIYPLDDLESNSIDRAIDVPVGPKVTPCEGQSVIRASDRGGREVNRLAGRVVIIAGGSKGFGKGADVALAAEFRQDPPGQRVEP